VIALSRTLRAALFALGCGAVASAACSGPAPDRNESARSRLDAPLPSAFCDALVDGVGEVPTETDYLPQVIACENGGAELEALKAQAVAARSVLYWTLGSNGSICDSQSCQVYSCAAEPLPIHIQAVAETSGEYLAYNGNVTYAFYVNGDPNTAAPSCIGAANASNENWITYNEGLSGSDVQQTALGFVHDPSDPGYGQNRGCQGQWGARCLEEQGFDYEAILRFYYGDDIQLLKAPGPCVTPDEPAGGGGANNDGGNTIGGAGVGAAGGGGSGTGPPNMFDDDDDTTSDGGCQFASPSSTSGLATELWLWLGLMLWTRRRR
jgi:Stage II sporulation protein